MADSTEMGRGDQENKEFDDLTSQGTFMGKADSPTKVIDDLASESSYIVKASDLELKKKLTDDQMEKKDEDDESDVQIEREWYHKYKTMNPIYFEYFESNFIIWIIKFIIKQEIKHI